MVQTQSQTYADLGFQVNPLSELMAAEVIGLDLSQPFDEATRDAVYDAFVTYQVLAFRDQRLTKAQGTVSQALI